MSNMYTDLKANHRKEVNDFPMMFAFSQSQFNEGMKKLGLSPDETDKVCSIVGGGYIRKSDLEALHEMIDRHDKEMKEAIASDSTGEGFIFQMFCYELGNHEYSYTREIDDTLDALDLTADQINADDRLLHGLQLACKKCIEDNY